MALNLSVWAIILSNWANLSHSLRSSFSSIMLLLCKLQYWETYIHCNFLFIMVADMIWI
jgi:hypothetical protein